jgi:hypothetical protein
VHEQTPKATIGMVKPHYMAKQYTTDDLTMRAPGGSLGRQDVKLFGKYVIFAYSLFGGQYSAFATSYNAPHQIMHRIPEDEHHDHHLTAAYIQRN